MAKTSIVMSLFEAFWHLGFSKFSSCLHFDWGTRKFLRSRSSLIWLLVLSTKYWERNPQKTTIVAKYPDSDQLNNSCNVFDPLKIALLRGSTVLYESYNMTLFNNFTLSRQCGVQDLDGS